MKFVTMQPGNMDVKKELTYFMYFPWPPLEAGLLIFFIDS